MYGGCTGTVKGLTSILSKKSLESPQFKTQILNHCSFPAIMLVRSLRYRTCSIIVVFCLIFKLPTIHFLLWKIEGSIQLFWTICIVHHQTLQITCEFGTIVPQLRISISATMRTTPFILLLFVATYTYISPALAAIEGTIDSGDNDNICFDGNGDLICYNPSGE